uniref:Uncharacterized protein n=1 Tax=Panagrolaimus superbus TaxID=310955 RepID=A0A914YBT5_9BILA
MDKFTKDQVQNAHYGTTLFNIFSFLLFLIYCILQNKNRIMGLIVEGRGGRPNGRRGASVRYRRLNTDDAEAGIQ